MFNWFKKKKQKEESKKILKIRKEKLDLGMTQVKITFLDGRVFLINIRGQFHPYFIDDTNIDYRSSIYKSSSKAMKFLMNKYNKDMTIVDDLISPTKSMIGTVIELEMLDSYTWLEDCEVPYFE